MLDVLIRNGSVVDGTGAPARGADVGIRDGRIVSLEASTERARQTIDADGLTLVPGFIDLHTHYDAQLFYEPALSPSPLHGVTTVIGGNCGLTLAPVAPGDEDVAHPAPCAGRVDPGRDARSAGSSTAGRRIPEFLDVVDAQPLGPNIGFLVGHSAIRRAVMGAPRRAPPRPTSSSPRCEAVLDDAIAAGGFGFSTANVGDAGRRRRPADPAELRDPRRVRRVGRRVRAAPGNARSSSSPTRSCPGSPTTTSSSWPTCRPRRTVVLNWNKPLVNKQLPDLHRRQLRACDVARPRGGRGRADDDAAERAHPAGLRAAGTCSARCPDGAGCSSSPSTTGSTPCGNRRSRDRLAQPRLDAETAGLAGRSRATWGRATSSTKRRRDPALHHLQGRRVGDIARERGVSDFDAALESPSKRSWTSASSATRTPTTTAGARQHGSTCSRTRGSCSARPTPERTWT